MDDPGEYSTNTNDMRAVHGALQSSLGSAEGLVTGAGNDPAAVATVSSFFDNVIEFLRIHHQGEDELIYPVLEARCPEHLEVISRVEGQHSLLDQPIASSRSAIDSWRSDPGPAAAGGLIDALSIVGDMLGPHLVDEEEHILPLATAYMSPEEWAELTGHSLRLFTGDKPWLALGLVREGLNEDQRSQMLAGMPVHLQELWAEEWEPAFTGFIGKVRAISA